MKDKGIFPSSDFGRVLADRTKKAVDGEFINKEHPLYYGDQCVNKLDYLALNAIMSELFMCIKDVLKYDPTKLDNLLQAIKLLIKKYGFYPDHPFIPDIKDHDPCNNTAEIVLVEKVQDNGTVKNQLTKIHIEEIIKIASHGINLNDYFTPSLIPHSDNAQDTKIVVESKYNKDGKLVNRLESFNFEDLPFNLNKEFTYNLEKFNEKDALEGIVVSAVRENNKHQLKYTDVKDLTKYLSDFDPSKPFSTPPAEDEIFDKVICLIKQQGEYQFVSVDPIKLTDSIVYQSSQTHQLNNKKINAKDIPGMVVMSENDFNTQFSDKNKAIDYFKNNFDKLIPNRLITVPAKKPFQKSKLELDLNYTSYNFNDEASIGSFLNVIYSVALPEENKTVDYSKIDFKEVVIVPTFEAISAIGISQQELKYEIEQPELEAPFIHYVYYIPNKIDDQIGLYAISDLNNKLHSNISIKVIERKT